MTTNNNAYIIAAYAVTWIALIGYAIRLALVSRRASRRFAEVSGLRAGADHE